MKKHKNTSLVPEARNTRQPYVVLISFFHRIALILKNQDAFLGQESCRTGFVFWEKVKEKEWQGTSG